jgi:hypothetical protein
MPIDDRTDIVPEATIPDNLDQPPRFGAITELVKDVFVLELREFLNVENTKLRAGELPRISKYSFALDTSVDPLETAVNLIRNYPDLTEDMPLIAVMATTGRNFKMDIGRKDMELVVPAAKVTGSLVEPFNIADGATLTIVTTPHGTPTDTQESTFTFYTYMFADNTLATAREVANAINMQALYAQAGHNGGALVLQAGGQKGLNFPNKVTVTAGTARATLGFSVNQTDQNYGTGKNAMVRKYMAAELTVGLEVVSESENVRTDITDLLYDFLSYVMEDKHWSFYGRSVFDPDVTDEYYQIVLKDSEISISGEQETPRPGDAKDKIYINRINLPVIAIQYSDRIIAKDVPHTPNVAETLLNIPEPN